MALRPTTVALVHPDAVVRQQLEQTLRNAGLEPVASVADLALADAALAPRWPDVIVAGAALPGLPAFLDLLLAQHPTPVVVSHDPADSGDAAVLALAHGAVDVVTCARTPHLDATPAAAVVAAVRGAALARVASSDWPESPTVPAPLAEPGQATDAFAPTAPGELDLPLGDAQRVAVLVAGIGAVPALEPLLMALPRQVPPLVVLQPLDVGLSLAWARRLNRRCAPMVAVAGPGAVLAPGRVLLVPGGVPALLEPRGLNLTLEFDHEAERASEDTVADGLLASLAAQAGPHALAVLMTGAGTDGARGLLSVREAGGHTAVQDDRSCSVPSRVREALRLGAASQPLTPAMLAAWLVAPHTISV
jgi:two-component system, chemotaxis family, protein-glutamate methylesterase/glutaminase